MALRTLLRINPQVPTIIPKVEGLRSKLSSKEGIKHGEDNDTAIRDSAFRVEGLCAFCGRLTGKSFERTLPKHAIGNI